MYSRYLGLAVGLWYVLAPFVWGYPSGFLWWHSLLLGAIIGLASASYLLSWNPLGCWVLIATGAYSMLAPFLHDYITSQFAFWNDLVFGIVTIGVGAALGAAGIEARASEEAEAA